MEASREEPQTKSKGTGFRVTLKPPPGQEENRESTVLGSREREGFQGGVS